ncbi:MAG: hypothetical protein ABI415_07415 [Flavitalea sp.]
MNTSINPISGKSLLFLTSLTILLFCSCAHKITFQQSSVVPAAQGTVKIKKDKNDNYSIVVNVEHLAGPERLTPAAATYIVWVETSDHQNKNIGQLKSSSNWLSKTLKGSLQSTTPFHPLRVFMTAENDAAISFPSGHMVLTTNPL